MKFPEIGKTSCLSFGWNFLLKHFANLRFLKTENIFLIDGRKIVSSFLKFNQSSNAKDNKYRIDLEKTLENALVEFIKNDRYF